MEAALDARTPLDEAPTAFADGSDAVRVRGLVKRYKDVVAVNGIDLTVKTGETFGFLGPNGAGKSTTINILCTLVEASEGTAEVAGLDVARERDAVRRNIGLVFQEPTLDGYLTAEQNLRFHGDLYGVDRATAAARRKEVLDMVGLWDRRKRPGAHLLRRHAARLEIARGLLHSPQVLFLDEPTIGLDPQTRTVIWRYIHELHSREAITVFVTTHYMDEAENCDRIAIMNAGKIVALDTPEALKAAIGKDRVQISTADDAGRDRRAQGQVRAGCPHSRGAGDLRGGRTAPPSCRSCSRSWACRSSRSPCTRPSLDDVFLAHTGTTLRDAESREKFNPMAARFRR